MKLIVGLGNPGTKYARTRHNVGWLVLDEMLRRSAGRWHTSGQAEVCEVRLGQQAGQAGEKVLLVRPQTYMNTSGQAVQPLVDYYRLSAADVLVVQDDLDSPFGLLKLKSGGRHGGQNGVRDIIRLLGTQDFARLKLGISRPPPGRDPADWVLSRWRDEEIPVLEQLVSLAASAAEVWAVQGLLAAQGQFNATDLRPAPAAAAEGTAASQAPVPTGSQPADADR